MICPNCKKKIPEDSCYCPECGCKIEAGSSENTNSKKREKKHILIGVFVVLVLFGVVGTAIWKNKSNNNKEQIANEDPSQTYEGDSNKEPVTVEKPTYDLTEVINFSISNLESMGFSIYETDAQGDVYRNTESNAIITVQDEKVISIKILGDSNWSCVGVKLGDTEETVDSKYQSAFDLIEDNDNKRVHGVEDQDLAIELSFQNQKVTEITFIYPYDFDIYYSDTEDTGEDLANVGGVYYDEESKTTLLIGRNGDKYLYSLCDEDGTIVESESECVLQDEYIAGQYRYFGENEDGTLNISSGVGGVWGRFQKVVADKDEFLFCQGIYSNDQNIVLDIQPLRSTSDSIEVAFPFATVKVGDDSVNVLTLIPQSSGTMIAVIGADQVVSVFNFSGDAVEIYGGDLTGVYYLNE